MKLIIGLRGPGTAVGLDGLVRTCLVRRMRLSILEQTAICVRQNLELRGPVRSITERDRLIAAVSHGPQERQTFRVHRQITTVVEMGG